MNLIHYYLILCWLTVAIALPTTPSAGIYDISQSLFESLEELARIVDISYCVGNTGISKPFNCLSRCSDFQGFELVKTWNTGPLLSDSCGYIAISHPPFAKRVIVAFRGTYSIASTIVDLSTNPSEYAPFPFGHENDSVCASSLDENEKEVILPQLRTPLHKRADLSKCENCTVHAGFMSSWRNTRCEVIPAVEDALNQFPGYELTLVGHSLGGAVAALAALEFQVRGWIPRVTTFGEPRVGNIAFNKFIDERFYLDSVDPSDSLYRRVTHVNDPVPLLPPEEWGYRMHAGEIYISKSPLPPSKSDLKHCRGDQDITCIAGGISATEDVENTDLELNSTIRRRWSVDNRFRLWELFFAHRDYFWRLGLCLPGGDPWDWNRERYDQTEMMNEL